MSNAVFPTPPPGFTLDTGKDMSFSTLIQQAVSGRELRISERAYPLYRHSLKYNFLRDTAAFPELKLIGGFYLARNGPADSFLFTDPDDFSVTLQSIGTGNGSNTLFQANRSFGGYTEPVFNINTITDIQVNGFSVAYSYSASTGVITCATPPAAAATVTWTGTYYFRCRFADDKMQFQKFMYQLWTQGKVDFISNLQDKIT